MAQSITTSIRLPQNIRVRLEKASHSLHRGKNWIITRALEAYLAKLHQNTLMHEARRQSIRAGRADKRESKHWENNVDTSGWA